NRQWNAALLTLLQRSGALRIVSEEQTPTGAELWVAEIFRPEIVSDDSKLNETLAPFLSVGESEAKAASRKASQLERALINEHEGCSRTLLFDMVEPSGSPWPCGRCSICVTVGEHANKRPDKHKFNVAWPDQAWAGRCALGGGAWVVNPDEPT